MAKRYLIPVDIEELEDTGGWLAICPVIPGCHAEGATIAEAIDILQDVARVLLELQLEDGLGLPEGLCEAASPSLQLHAEVPVTVG